MSSEWFCIMDAVLIAVILNIVLPMIFVPFASEEELNPPNGAAALSLESQFMHMMVHHNQVPVMSSVIVALIVGLSVFFGYYLKPFENMENIMK